MDRGKDTIQQRILSGKAKQHMLYLILKHIECLLNSVFKNCDGAQWDRAFALQAEGWVFESQPRPSLVVKTSNNCFTANCSAKGVSVTVLGDDHYKRLPRVTVVVARYRTLTTQLPREPSVGHYLQPFTGNVEEIIFPK